MLDLLLGAALVCTVLLLASEVASLRRMPRADTDPEPSAWPRVSVLVPARDEEDDVRTCVRSLLAQDYPAFHVLALDDGSTDRTLRVLEDEAADSGGLLRVLHGTEPPRGWLGKPWACAQLAEAADGELLLFTDADTVHEPGALRATVSALVAEDADLLSALTFVEDRSWGEHLVLPCVPWSSVTMVPLPLAYRTRAPWVSAANGQYMLFRREGYDAVGGHGAVRGEVVEDMALARRIKAAGRTWRMTDATGMVRTRMYRDLRGVFGGLGKNLFSVFGDGVVSYLLAWAAIAVVFLVPPATLLGAAAGVPSAVYAAGMAFVAWALMTLQFAIGFRRFGYGAGLALLYPVMIAVIIAVAAWSLVVALSGSAVWKGRALGRPTVRWL